jgi:hypothetical protein
LRRALREQQQHWRDTDALPLPKPKVQGLRRDWQRALDAAEAKLGALDQQTRQAALDALAARADWCDQTARKLVGDGAEYETDAAALRAAWTALPDIDDAATAARLEDAAALLLAAADGDAAARTELNTRLADAERTRRALCLRLEVAAGVASPPELEAERMNLQVERLRARMGGSDAARDDQDDPLTLLRQWYANTPAAPAADLDARCARVRAALLG